jgi:DNA end-binding protein Ku
MVRSEQIALGRVVLSTRERILALEPRGEGILAYSLRTDAEVRKESEIFGSIAKTKPDPGMIDIAEKIIEQKEGPFDPSKFVDRYEEALKALIAEKQKGHKPVAAEEPDDTNVVDLMAALKASLAGKAAKSTAAGKGTKAKPPEKSKPAPRRKAG